MAFDGITMACMAKELNNALSGGRISRIIQPEEDEVLLQIHSDNGNHRLLIRANASLPLIYLTGENRPAPASAPNFCMVLRKYLQGGRILAITQPGLERVLHIRVSHLDEMGDPGEKLLIFELMGKHSNLILTDEKGMILDGIKHIGAGISSIREVLPGRSYFLPNTRGKRDLLLNPVSEEEFWAMLQALPPKVTAKQSLVDAFTGISPTAALELCHSAGTDADLPCGSLSKEQAKALYRALADLLNLVGKGEFSPAIYYEHHVPREFSVFRLSHYGKDQTRTFTDLSSLLQAYYRGRERADRIRQKSADLRHIVSLALERNVKKYDLQLAQLKDTEKRINTGSGESCFMYTAMKSLPRRESFPALTITRIKR